MNAQHAPGPSGRTPLNWIVVNPDGKLLAILDSESEAYFFTKNRGHAEGAKYSTTSLDYAAAPDLLAALEEITRYAAVYLKHSEKWSIGERMLTNALAAIAKAKGQQ